MEEPTAGAPRPVRPGAWVKGADQRRAGKIAHRRELELRAKAKIRLDQLRTLRMYGEDRWRWIADCVQTEDPHDKSSPIKPMPSEGDLGHYLQLLTYAISGSIKHAIELLRLLGVLKSRRLIVSWLVLANLVGKCIFGSHEYIFIGARKMGEHENEGSLELIKRCKIILNNLRGGPRPKFTARQSSILFPDTQSQIIAVAEGSDQLRQVAATAVFLDEFAFWPEAKATWGGLKPTVENKGQIIYVTTAGPGFAWDFSHDRIEMAKQTTASGIYTGTRVRTLHREHLMTGVQGWKTSAGVHIRRVHYSADQRKRSLAWINAAKEGMSKADWDREMEISGDVWNGKPIFEQDYNDERMVKPAPLEIDPRRSMLRVWDFGYRHPCCLVGQLYNARQFRIYRCWLGTDTDLRPFASDCLRLSKEIFGVDRRWIEGGDIAGEQVKSTGAPDIEVLSSEFNLQVRAEKIPVKKSIGLVREFMSHTWQRGEPLLVIEDNPDTEYLRLCLKGGYHYREDSEEPDEDGFYEHGGDTLRYLVWLFHLEGTSEQAELEAMAMRAVEEYQRPPVEEEW